MTSFLFLRRTRQTSVQTTKDARADSTPPDAARARLQPFKRLGRIAVAAVAALLLAPIAFAATCSCEVTCTRGNGAPVTQSWNEDDMSQFPPSQALKCKDRCQATLNQKTSEWALAGKWCKTGSCDGTSKLGTLNRVNLDAVSYDNSRQEFCWDKPETALCCPSYLSANNLISMFDNAGHNTPAPYFMAMSATAPAFLAFANAVNAQLALARAGACGRNAAAIRVTYTMYNTNSTSAPTAGSVPTTLPGPPWSVIGTPFSATFTGLGSVPTLSIPNPGFNVVVNPNYFVVIASATVLNAMGQPVQCADVSSDCFKKQRFGDIHNPVSIQFKVTPGTATPPAPAAATTRVIF